MNILLSVNKFSKSFITLGKDSQNFAIGKEKESILCEIKANKLYPISKPRQSRKRSGDRAETERSKRVRRLFRSFRNPQMESCWLNSCMQLVLTAFDHLSDLATDGSALWKLLLSYRMKDEDEIMNPLEVRDLKGINNLILIFHSI